MMASLVSAREILANSDLSSMLSKKDFLKYKLFIFLVVRSCETLYYLSTIPPGGDRTRKRYILTVIKCSRPALKTLVSRDVSRG